MSRRRTQPRVQRGDFLPKFAAWLVALALVALPIVALVQGWYGSDRFPLRQLELEGRFERVSTGQVEDAVKPEVGSGFFAVRLDRIRRTLERLPVVAQVEVRKRWPDVISVRIVERSAVATYGEGQLVDSNGVVFGPYRAELDGALPHLAGPESATATMLEKLAASRGALEPAGLEPVRLEMSARGGVHLTLATGAGIELGREGHAERLDRFVAAWPKVPQPAGMELARADLRYANGFAIEWRAVPAPPPPEPPPSAPPAPQSAPEAPAEGETQNPEQPNA